jgi:DeoR/GlpR family transcriptional regulator of sugar metabolism
MPAAELLADLGDVDVHLLGGQYFRRTSLLLGPRTVAAARRWRFDVALLGVEGIDRAGLWNSLRDVVSLQRAVLRASALSVVLADGVKFGRRAAEFLGRASLVDRILTDVSPSDFEAAGLRPGQRLNITKGGTKP